jgi:sugar lactone lactonase YvrE
MHVALSSLARLCRRLPVVCVLVIALAVVLLPAVARAQVVSFDGVGTVLPLTGLSNPATLDVPGFAAVDGAGNVYVADTGNNRVVKVTPAGIATVLNTGSLTSAVPGGCSTGLCRPSAVAADSAGDVYIADEANDRVVQVTAAGVASVFNTGSLSAGNGNSCAGHGTVLCEPYGIAVDSAGNVYIADSFNYRVAKVTPAGVGSVLNLGSPGGLAVTPTGVAVDGAGDVYITDDGSNGGIINSRVLKVTAAGVVSVLGTGSLTAPSGSVCGTTVLCDPRDVAVDSAGDVFIADTGNGRVVEVTATGVASVVSTGGLTPPSGSGCSTVLCHPFGVAVDSTEDVYIADTENQRVVEVSPNVNFGSVPVASAPTANQHTLMFSFAVTDTLTAVNVLTLGAAGKDFTADPSSSCVANSQFGPYGEDTCTVAVDFSPSAPGLRMGAVQLVDANGVQATTFLRAMGQGPQAAFQPGLGSLVNAGSPSGKGLTAPYGVAVDGAGDIFIADYSNSRVVEVNAAGVASLLITGSLTLSRPMGVAVDGAGDVYIADTYNNRVVEVTAAGVASVISTGSLTINYPTEVAVDGAGDVYIADTANSRFVEVTAAGAVSVLNVGTPGGKGLFYPEAIAWDGAGDAYIADSGNSRVVEVTAAGVSSVFSTGSLTAPSGSGCSTALCYPQGIAVDGAGDVYIADSTNNRMVEVSPTGAAGTLSMGHLTPSTIGGCFTSALCFPSGLAVDSAGDLFIADTYNNRIAEVSQAQTAPLTFAVTSDGYTSSDSPQNVFLQNIGNQPLILSAVATATAGQTAGSFNLDGTATTCSGSTSLNPGDTCGLGVEFEPLSSGPLSGSVSITDNNLYSSLPAVITQQITLSGTGVGYEATIGLEESSTSVVYGTAVSVTATLTGTNGVPTGSVSYSVDGVTLGTAPLTAGATSSSAQISLPATINAGIHGVEVTYAGDANYAAPTTSGFSLTVNADATTTTLAAPSSSVAGSSVSLQATVLVGATPVTSGTVTFATTISSATVSLGAALLGSAGTATLATTALPIGNNSVTATFVGTTNFTASVSSDSTVVVSALTAPAYTISASPNTLSIAQGATGSTTLTFTPVGGYTGSLTLTCGDLPSYVTCAFIQNGVANSTVTMSGNNQPVTVTLTISTNVSTARLYAVPAARPNSPPSPSAPFFFAIALWLPAGFTGLASLRRRKLTAKTRWLPLIALAVLALSASLSSCGGSSTTTPAGGTTIMITATPSAGSGSSQSSQTLTFTLTITS